MSEEQVNAAEAEAVKEEEEEVVEEISEEDLEGVTGGLNILFDERPQDPTAACTCGEENCDCVSCDSESTAD